MLEGEREKPLDLGVNQRLRGSSFLRRVQGALRHWIRVLLAAARKGQGRERDV
jgi:hypothetical protein